MNKIKTPCNPQLTKTNRSMSHKKGKYVNHRKKPINSIISYQQFNHTNSPSYNLHSSNSKSNSAIFSKKLISK